LLRGQRLSAIVREAPSFFQTSSRKASPKPSTPKRAGTSKAKPIAVERKPLAKASPAFAASVRKILRIHPFVNGNGRIARLIGHAWLVRYGLPPVLQWRPRPKDGYIQAASRAMVCDQKAMVTFVKAALQQR
jgi:fido (protein-threonine AMPylation protein)